MDSSNIPKTFWHSVSICILAVTFGLLYLAHRSASVSIKFANVQIVLSSAAAELEGIKVDLEEDSNELAARWVELERREKELDELVESVSAEMIPVDEIRWRISTAEERTEMPRLELAAERFDEVDKRLKTVQAIVRQPWEQRQ